MNLARLSLAYLKARPLNTALNLVPLALGVDTITLLALANHQIEERMGRDARGIDLVVGAKGSPMQLKQDETPDPLRILRFGPDAVMLDPHAITHLIE